MDLFRLFMGEVKTIHAKVDNIVQKTPVEDIGFISIVGQNGSHGHIMSTNSLPVVRNMFEIHGTEATLTVNYYIPRRPDLTIQNKNEETERAIEVSGPFKFTAMISHFLDCIKNDTPPESTVHDGLQSSRIIEAAYQSSKTNKAIEINS